MPKNTKKKSKNSDSAKLSYTGKLEVTRSGMGFVIVQGLETDIMIDRSGMGHALHGDETLIEG
jgi:ribonuclease R